MPPSTPTAPDGAAHAVRLRTVLIRRVSVALLAVFVAAGVAGVLGVRRQEVRAAAGGLDVTVRYATVTRGSMDASVEISAQRDGGLVGELTVTVPLDYLGSFTDRELVPVPSNEQVAGDRVVWTFDVDGDRVVVRIGLRAAPGAAGQRIATVTVSDDRDAEVAVDLTTWLLP